VSRLARRGEKLDLRALPSRNGWSHHAPDLQRRHDRLPANCTTRGSVWPLHRVAGLAEGPGTSAGRQHQGLTWNNLWSASLVR